MAGAEERERLAEQRYTVKFLQKSGRTRMETLGIIRATYGEHAMTRPTIYRWYDAFEKGRETARLRGGPGAPITKLTETTINTCRALLVEDPSFRLVELASILDISVGSAHHLVTKILGYSKLCAKWVPKLLTDEQKAERVRISHYWEKKLLEDPEWFDNVITTDESWAYMYDPATKQQSKRWVRRGGSGMLKQKSQKSMLKVMIVTFFDKKGMIYTHTVPSAAKESKNTVTGARYKDILMALMRNHLPRKRPEYAGGNWKLHMDNARPHMCKLVTKFLAKKGIEVVPHPPYSPDMAPSDFFLYPSMKSNMRGVKYESREEIIQAVYAELKRLSKNGLSHVFEMWRHRWNKCIRLQGEYVKRTRENVTDL